MLLPRNDRLHCRGFSRKSRASGGDRFWPGWPWHGSLRASSLGGGLLLVTAVKAFLAGELWRGVFGLGSRHWRGGHLLLLLLLLYFFVAIAVIGRRRGRLGLRNYLDRCSRLGDGLLGGAGGSASSPSLLAASLRFLCNSLINGSWDLHRDRGCLDWRIERFTTVAAVVTVLLALGDWLLRGLCSSLSSQVAPSPTRRCCHRCSPRGLSSQEARRRRYCCHHHLLPSFNPQKPQVLKELSLVQADDEEIRNSTTDEFQFCVRR